MRRQILGMLSGILLGGLLYFRLYNSGPFGWEWYQAALFLSPIGLTAVFPRARLAALMGLMVGPLLAEIAHLVQSLYRDPGCCNLWPIGLVILFIFCVPTTLIGALTGNLLGRARFPQPYYFVLLALILLIAAASPYIKSVQQHRLQTVTIPRVMNRIYEAQVTHRARYGAYACDGKELSGVEKLDWGHVGRKTVNDLLIFRYYTVRLECLNNASPPSFRVTAFSHEHEYSNVPTFLIDSSGKLAVSRK